MLPSDPHRCVPDEPTCASVPAPGVWFLVACNVVATACGLVHVVVPDSGAGSIAGVGTAGAGGQHMVALPAEWGGARLRETRLIWIVLRRHRGVVPLRIGLSLLDDPLRVLSV
jgi:hypothetical protein